jgi:hypothetical protein
VVGCWKLYGLLGERELSWRAHLRVGEVVGRSEKTVSPGFRSPNCQVQYSPNFQVWHSMEMVEESRGRRLPMFPEGSSLQMSKESWIFGMEE